MTYSSFSAYLAIEKVMTPCHCQDKFQDQDLKISVTAS